MERDELIQALGIDVGEPVSDKGASVERVSGKLQRAARIISIRQAS